MGKSEYAMKVKFYGTRGSIPICGMDFQLFGGNTSCIRIEHGIEDKLIILDAGSGIRNLGKELMALGDQMPKNITIGFSHFHWDHIQGFPFFDPAYEKDVQINILAMGNNRKPSTLKHIFASQMQSDYFPISLEEMGAKFNFIVLGKTIRQNMDQISARTQLHNHPGGAYSFRIEKGGKILVVCTDIEHAENIDPNIVALARGADLLVHDAQYTPKELLTKKAWGHSSYEQAIEVAQLAGAKQLIMTHHDPDHNDDFLLEMEKKCQSLFSNCALAREGMEIVL